MSYFNLLIKWIFSGTGMIPIVIFTQSERFLSELIGARLIGYLTLYSIITPFDAIVISCICSIFQNIFKTIKNLTEFFLTFFSMLSKNRK